MAKKEPKKVEEVVKDGMIQCPTCSGNDETCDTCKGEGKIIKS